MSNSEINAHKVWLEDMLKRWYVKQEAQKHPVLGSLSIALVIISSKGLLVGIALLLSAYLCNGFKYIKFPPVLVICTMVWSLVGLLVTQSNWTVLGSTMLLHSFLVAVIFSTIVHHAGTEKSLNIILAAFCIILFLNYLSVFQILPIGRSVDATGNWLGLSSSKNIGAHNSAITIILLVWLLLRGKVSLLLCVFLVASAIYLWNNLAAHTAVIALMLTLPLTILLRLVWKWSKLVGRIAVVCVALSTLIGSALSAFYPSKTEDVLVAIADLQIVPDLGGGIDTKFATLSGRTTLWRITLQAAENNTFLGMGFTGAFIDDPTSVYRQAVDGSIAAGKTTIRYAHPHHGILASYLETGLFGMILFMLAYFIVPLIYILAASHIGEKRWVLINLWLYSVLANITEPFLAQRSNLNYGMFAVISILLLISIIARDEIVKNKKNAGNN